MRYNCILLLKNQKQVFFQESKCESESEVAQSCLTLCDPMDYSTPGLPVHPQIPKFAQTRSIKLVMPSNHLILCRPLLFLPPIPPSIRVFSNESTLCMDCSTPCLPVHHQLPKLTQTHVHWVGDAIQPSHPLLSPSSPAFNLSQHQGLFQGVNSSHEVAKVSEFQLQHQSFQWTFRTDFL